MQTITLLTTSQSVSSLLVLHSLHQPINLVSSFLVDRYKLRNRGPRPKENVEEEGPATVSIVLKGDVDGSVEALLDTLDTYHGTDCHLDLVSYGVGPITPTDVNMAALFSGQ